MRIAHISDLHIDAKYKHENLLNTERLLDHICRKNFDHVIISGDITESAEDSEFELARKLFKKYGLLDSARLTVIIGNHDVFGGVHLAEDLLNFPARCRAADFDDKVKKFCHYFRETFENTTRPADNRFFPFIKNLGKAVLVGLNSVSEYSPLKNPFASNGKISSSRLNVMHKMLKGVDTAGKRVLVLAHHHFKNESLDFTSSSGSIWQSIEKMTMKLRNKKRIIRSLKKAGADIILHGHLHQNTSYTKKGLRFLNAGGSVMGCKKNQLSFNEVIINEYGLFHKVTAIEYAVGKNRSADMIQPAVYLLPNRITDRNLICMN